MSEGRTGLGHSHLGSGGRNSGAQSQSLRRRLSKLRMWGFRANGTSTSAGSSSSSNLIGAGKTERSRRQAMEILVLHMSSWRERSTHELHALLLQLRSYTENDDMESQYCRMAAFSIVPKLAEILAGYSGSTEPVAIHVLSESLACLRFVTKGEGTNISSATNCGVLLLCRDIMRMYGSHAEIQRYCCMVFRSLTFNRADNQRYVVQVGVVPLILAAMRRFHADPTVQSAALMSIQNITWLVEDNRTTVERESGIQQILEAMVAHKENVEVQKWACGALQNLACCVYCTMRLLEIGALHIVLGAMANHPFDPTVQNYGLGVLRNISYLRENRMMVAQSGAIPLAIRAMKLHLDDIEVQNSAASFFFNTVIDVEDNSKIVLSHEGLLPILFAAKAAHDKEVRFADKANALLDQLARNTQGLYIDLHKQVGPHSLRELAMRVAANDMRSCVYMPDELKYDMVRARRCDMCQNNYVQCSLVACKQKNMSWVLYHVCGQKCASTAVKETLAQHRTVTAMAAAQARGGEEAANHVMPPHIVPVDVPQDGHALPQAG
eukprot:comp16899_c0_seq1/m.15424 comp16899_c0_seq1/g.15424  ORF comp16899_c0_seq1/g.15424 comp16899_c0_seq1/m.15424 type:complete len:551 (-) comp16899_c0_seq1:1000-2652(-)